MKSTVLRTGSPSPMPAKAGVVATTEAVPVKRRELPKEERAFATVLPPVEPEPPGPSPETVLHDVAMHAFIQHRTKAPTQPSVPTTIGVTKNVPARVRANPAVAAALHHPPPQQQQAAVAGGAASGKAPPSSYSSDARPPSGLSAKRSASTLTNFDEEMDDIRRQHARDDEAARAGGRSTSSLGGGSRRSPSPFDRPASTLNADDYEEVDGEEAASTTATGKPIYVPYTPDLRAKLGAATSLHTHVSQKPLVLRDYQMLAEACQRAGRARTEGHAYYKMGELLSKNKRDTLPKSVMYFKRYLNISRRLNDLQGEAKALNCLGIVHYEMGGANNMHIALEYHRQHAEIADAAGIFIANTNMGLAHLKLGDHAAAIECQKQALQYAVRAGDKAAESLALANLGQAGTKQGDVSTAKVCVERHLELVTTLRDDRSACEAYEQLGVLSTQRGDFASASENLLLALDVAIRCGDQEKAKHLRCQVGFVQGMLRLDDQMRNAAGMMGSNV